MADNESNDLEVRDLREQDEGPYLTVPRATLELEERLENDNAVAGPTIAVNPNPVGSKDEESGGVYVGTDPIYQNSSTDANRPYAGEEGVFQKVEEQLEEDYDVSDVKSAADYGLGGEAEVAAGDTGGRTFRTILPGQEGYDLQKAEEQNGPPLRVYADEEGEDGEDEVAKADDLGTNFGSTVTPPTAPETPENAGQASGNKPAKKAAAKPQSSDSDN